MKYKIEAVSFICKAQCLGTSLILFGLIKEMSKVTGTSQINFIVVRAPEFSYQRKLLLNSVRVVLKMQDFKISEVKNYIEDGTYTKNCIYRLYTELGTLSTLIEFFG